MLRKFSRFIISLSILCPILTAALYVFDSWRSNVLEDFYSRTLYPSLAQSMGFLSSVFPFSMTLASFVVLLMLLVTVPLAVVAINRKARRKVRMQTKAASLAFLLTGANIYCLYLWLWGFHYLRDPFTSIQRDMTDHQVRKAMTEFALTTSRLRTTLKETKAGCFESLADLEALDLEVEVRQNFVLEQLGFPRIRGIGTKKQILSGLWLKIGSAGIYGPFTGERNVSWPIAPGLEAATVAHERAHFAGFATEDSAEFIGLLTVLSSSSPVIQYSGWLRLWTLLDYEDAISYPLSEAVRRDLLCVANYWHAHLGDGHEIAYDLYDSLLKAQGSPSGIKSYQEAVKLLVHHKNIGRQDWVPIKLMD